MAASASGFAFVTALLQLYSLSVHPEGALVKVAEWIHIGNLALDWTFRVDTLSVTMMLVVSGVGTLIHIYAIGYMHEDVRFKHDEKRYRRFFVFMNLFIAMMMILVSGDSYLMLFVGWEDHLMFCAPFAVPFPPTRSRAKWDQFLQKWYMEWGGKWQAPSK